MRRRPWPACAGPVFPRKRLISVAVLARVVIRSEPWARSSLAGSTMNSGDTAAPTCARSRPQAVSARRCCCAREVGASSAQGRVFATASERQGSPLLPPSSLPGAVRVIQQAAAYPEKAGYLGRSRGMTTERGVREVRLSLGFGAQSCDGALWDLGSDRCRTITKACWDGARLAPRLSSPRRRGIQHSRDVCGSRATT